MIISASSSIVISAGLPKLTEPFDHVVDIAKRARLLARAVNGNGPVGQRLSDEICHDAPVIGMHARPVGVEDAGKLDAHAVLAPIIHEQRFGAALALVIARAQADRIDMTVISLHLRVDRRVAIHLAG
jgi:hypothetical protein